VLAAAPQSGAGPWGERSVSTAVDFAMSAATADVDLDGDVDVFSVGRLDGIRWHENALGDASEWTDHLITLLPQGWSVFAADIDGDGNIDAVSGASGAGSVRWHENSLGDGSLWITHPVSVSSLSARSVHAADFDGDGDIDVLSGAEDTGAITWYRNVAGDGSAWGQQVIAVNQRTLSVHTADVDGDGDTDVLSASSDDDKVAWFENLEGNATTWLEHVVTQIADGAHSARTTDVDGDGDLDIISASFQDRTVSWHKNLSPDGTLWKEFRINVFFAGFTAVESADIDLDGDPDVFSASFSVIVEPPFVAAPVVGYENRVNLKKGWSTFSMYTQSGKARSLSIADLDGDCDLDVVFSSSDDDLVGWTENRFLSTDCNANGLADRCEVLAGSLPDCNGNLIPDACDIARGISRDVFGIVLAPPAPPKLQRQGNGIPDECEAPFYFLPIPSSAQPPPVPGGLASLASLGSIGAKVAATAGGAPGIGLEAGVAFAGAPFVLVASTDDASGRIVAIELGTLDAAGRGCADLALGTADEQSLAGRRLECRCAVLDARGRVVLFDGPVALELTR
jgi:hypothetical protein